MLCTNDPLRPSQISIMATIQNTNLAFKNYNADLEFYQVRDKC